MSDTPRTSAEWRKWFDCRDGMNYRWAFGKMIADLAVVERERDSRITEEQRAGLIAKMCKAETRAEQAEASVKALTEQHARVIASWKREELSWDAERTALTELRAGLFEELNILQAERDDLMKYYESVNYRPISGEPYTAATRDRIESRRAKEVVK